MAKIHYPILNCNESRRLFIHHLYQYNKGKVSRDRLKRPHIALFKRILALIANQQYERNSVFSDTPILRVIDTTKVYEFDTNNVKLSWVEAGDKASTKSVGRWIDRLIASGAIKSKKSRGSKKNYILYINPAMLLFEDLEKKISIKENKASKSINSGFQKDEETKSPLIKNLNSKKKKNNLIIPVRETNRSQEFFDFNFLKEKDNTGNPCKNKVVERINREHLKSLASQKKETKVARAATNEKTKLERYQEGTAKYFFTHLINNMFKDRPEIVDMELDNAREYVVRNYFTRTTGFKETDQLLDRLKWRVNIACRWIKRKKFVMKNIFPCKYLDISRRGTNPATGKSYMSFINLSDWDVRYRELKKADRLKRLKDKQEKEYNQILAKYLERPNMHMFRQTINELRAKLPQFEEVFLKEASAKISA